MATPFVSVIIPVHNDRDRLQQCLKAIYFQTYPYSYYELLVIDNNSTENLFYLCQQFPNVRYYQESECGSYAARNKGVRVARGEVIAFTDSDCIPDRHWLTAGVGALLQRPEAGMIGGAVQFYFRGDRPNPVEYFDSIFYLQQQTYVEHHHYAVTANLFTRRLVLETVGGFDQQLLNLGDKEWGQRVFAAGWQISFCPDAIIRHPARSDLSALLEKGRRQARANYQISQMRGEKPPVFSFLPMGWAFWCSVYRDPNLPAWREKVIFVWIVHRFKWAVARVLARHRLQELLPRQ